MFSMIGKLVNHLPGSQGFPGHVGNFQEEGVKANVSRVVIDMRKRAKVVNQVSVSPLLDFHHQINE